MKDATKEVLESSRPDKDAKDTIKSCLSQLYADEEHEIEDEIVNNLTFEELIGALLLARDEISRLEDEIYTLNEYDEIYTLND